MFTIPVKLVELFGKLLKALPFILIALAAIFIVTKIQSCSVFGDTKTELKAAVKDKDAIIKTIDQVNTDLSKDIKLIKDSGVVSTKAVEAVSKSDKTIVSIKTKREQKVVAKLKLVEDVYKNVVPSDGHNANEELQNSTIQIDAIWEAYNSAVSVNGRTT